MVGSVISAAMVVAVVGALWLKGINFGQAMTAVEVRVASVGQLMEGNPVVYLGVPIGRVSAIEVDTTGAFVRIALELEGNVRIDDQNRALIAPQSLFGDWQLEIVTLSRFPETEFYEVRPGMTVDGVRVIGGYALPDISRLTEAADQISRNLAVLTDRFDRAFNEETADALAETFIEVRQISQDVRELISQQAATFERVGGQVESAAGEVRAAATVGRGTLERLDELMARGEVDSVLVNLRAATASMQQTIAQFQKSASRLEPVLARADTSFRSLNRITSHIESGRGTLGRLLTDTAFAARTEGVVFQLEQLLLDMRANPGRYIRLSIF
jgi:phospholipid/cholesterol/gamma-HCH transport system substrate-binding protein